MFARGAVLLLLVMTCMWERADGRRWKHRRRWISDDDEPIKTTVKTDVTRYGHNLCHECITTTYPCTQTVKKPCRYGWRKVKGRWQPLNTTSTNSSGDYYKAWNDEGGEERRKKRSVPPRRLLNTLPWNKWENNNFRSDDSVNSTRADNVTRSYPQRPLCSYNWTKVCTERRCVMKCCDGSPMDSETNSCTENRGKLDACYNGGTLNSEKTQCSCPTGFMGTQCQNRKCSVKCQNGGVCQTRNNRNTTSLGHTNHNDDFCVCPSNTEGRFCEEKICRLECQNNGTCVSTSYHYNYCRCPRGVTGTLCEKGQKEGECPSSSTLQDCNWMHFRYECHMDHECPRHKKCCRNTCHQRICVNPQTDNSTCLYNNVTYTLGSAFAPDPCHVCTCNASHVGAPQGVIECARIRCPPMPVYCSKVVTPEGACCPICDEDPDVALCAGNYTFPHFLHCPNDLVTLHVDKDSNLAPVDLDLQARDCRGMPLKVLMSEKALMAGIGEENFQLLTASSERDSKGNFAECAFHVKVKDPYPPLFVTCPTDIVLPHPGPVHWEMPVAKDNVGLAVKPTSRRHPGDTMTTGHYLIEYWAEDFQGNVGECKFLVTIENRTDQHHGQGPFGPDQGHTHLHGNDHGHSHAHGQASHSSMTIGVSVGTSVIVVVLLGLAGFFWHRQRRLSQPAALTTAAPGTTTNNNMTNAGMRWNLNNPTSGPLPQYSLPPADVMSPPMYSRTNEMTAGYASGGQEAGELPTKNSLA